MKTIFLKWIHKILFDETGGGGSKPAFFQAPPQPPAPSPQESAKGIYEARLQYDPQVAAMEQQLAEQYYPQQAALQAALYQQYAPQMAGVQDYLRQAFSPEQYALTNELAQQARTRLASPFAETPEETTATEAIRQRERGNLTRQIQTSANLGGGLYGGRRELREDRGLMELGQAFAMQDIIRRQQAAENALRWAIPSIQQLYPQTQYPGQAPLQSPVGQSAVPSADALYNAMYGASRNEYGFQPGSPSPMWGIGGQAAGGAAMGLALAM